jgi:hypothetical protein
VGVSDGIWNRLGVWIRNRLFTRPNCFSNARILAIRQLAPRRSPTAGRTRETMKVKNEHVVWAYGDDAEGRRVVVFGITDTGIEYLQSEPGMTLFASPPAGVKWAEVSNVIVFAAKDKTEVKSLLKKAGMVVSEVH